MHLVPLLLSDELSREMYFLNVTGGLGGEGIYIWWDGEDDETVMGNPEKGALEGCSKVKPRVL